MYRKTCPYCKGDSYSSFTSNWICPYCGADLSATYPLPVGYAPDKTEGESAEKVKLLLVKPEKGRKFPGR